MKTRQITHLADQGFTCSKADLQGLFCKKAFLLILREAPIEGETPSKETQNVW